LHIRVIKKVKNDVFKIMLLETGAQILTVPGFDDTGLVKTFFTSRKGGVSTGAYASLNFGGRNDDASEKVSRNRESVFGALGFDDPIAVFPEQVHEDKIACVRRTDIVASRNMIFPDTDAVITRERNIILTSMHADCIPVYLFDPINKVIGMVHAGWRGTKLAIGAKTAKKMVEDLGAEYACIKAAIGPGISICCFEVEQGTYDEFKETTENIDEFTVKNPDGKYNIDLKALNIAQLKAIGVNDIVVSDYCTVCESELFYSHRRENGVTGRMGAGIGLL